jgi:predicted CoA-binding protein
MDGKPDIEGLLGGAKRIAVLGLSPKPARKSNQIGQFLVNAGYEVVPVNPVYEVVLGERSYPDLQSVPGDVDMAVVFRAPEYTAEVLDDAKASGVNCVWFQPGAFDDSLTGSEYLDGIDIFYGD